MEYIYYCCSYQECHPHNTPDAASNYILRPTNYNITQRSILLDCVQQIRKPGAKAPCIPRYAPRGCVQFGGQLHDIVYGGWRGSSRTAQRIKLDFLRSGESRLEVIDSFVKTDLWPQTTSTGKCESHFGLWEGEVSCRSPAPLSEPCEEPQPGEIILHSLAERITWHRPQDRSHVLARISICSGGIYLLPRCRWQRELLCRVKSVKDDKSAGERKGFCPEPQRC